MNKKKQSQNAIIASNLFSTLGGSLAACCTGPGIVACAATCAPSCGSVGFSIFGFSSMAVTNWLSNYWQLFLILSILSFIVAFYKLFLKRTCGTTKKSKIFFIISVVFSVGFLLKSFLSC